MPKRVDSLGNARLNVVKNSTSSTFGRLRDVNKRAFGQDQEANIVDALRSNGSARLSLVATLNDRVVGHIMYSPLTVGQITGAGLGPMAVLPENQRQGVGSKLIVDGNRELKEAGCPFIVVLGHADYYPRFGFRPARAHGITCEWDVPEEVFMVLGWILRKCKVFPDWPSTGMSSQACPEQRGRCTLEMEPAAWC